MFERFECPIPFTVKDGVVEVPAVADAPQLKAIFERSAQCFMVNPDAARRSESSFVASAIYTEAIPLLAEAASFATACRHPVRIGRRVFVEFVGVHGRPRCVECSALTVHLLTTGCPVPATTAEALDALRQWLRCLAGGALPQLRGANDPAIVLERAACVVWADALHGVLVPDALGIYPITPAALSTLARAEANAPPREPVGWHFERLDDIDDPGDLDNVEDEFEDSALEGLRDRIQRLIADTDGGNLADNSRRLLDRLALLAVEYDGPTARMIIEGAVGLFSVGTLTKDLPSRSILARYAAQQAETFIKHSKQALALSTTPPRERGHMYQDWWRVASTPSDCRPALKAYDKYICLRHDIEPAVFDSEEPSYPAPSSAALLWRDEIDWIVQSIVASARSPEIARVALAVLCIACRRPSRPGHLIHTRRSDVVELPSGEIVHWVRKRRGGLTVKTASAVGPFTFSDRSDALPLLTQKGTVVGSDDQNDGPLWGATEKESRRLFREAVLLIGRLCRIVTGDASASFYTLRHSVFTHRLVDLLMAGSSVDPRALDRLLDEGGHYRSSSTMRSYFHLPMSVVRACADRLVERLMTPAMAAGWVQ